MPRAEYTQLLQNKITEDYKVVSQENVDSTNDKSREIVSKLVLSERLTIVFRFHNFICIYVEP